jgi:hypothetical protein
MLFKTKYKLQPQYIKTIMEKHHIDLSFSKNTFNNKYSNYYETTL